uniref:Secreted protein n=1 Tax=Strongyloides venezuelensis TaxID=75913 RepID=A0A0K0FHD4_STRVS
MCQRVLLLYQQLIFFLSIFNITKFLSWEKLADHPVICAFQKYNDKKFFFIYTLKTNHWYHSIIILCMFY